MIKVSIVEDTPQMRELLINTIQKDPDLLFISAHATVEDAQAQLPVLNPDIVLLDINMNGKSGIEVISKVKEVNPDIRFLMCTVFQDDDKIFESLKAGATGYVLKKAGGATIINNIKDLYNGGSPMSPEIARKVVSFFLLKSNKLGNLSNREIQVLEYLSYGGTYMDAAIKLEISHATLRNHANSIYKKLQVKNRTEAVNIYRERKSE